jgi:zinc transport system ATP-binding protein
MRTNALRVSKLSFSYTEDPVLTDVNFKLPEQECMVIFGSNGSGKSTLLRLILGQLRAKSGDIEIFGQDVQNKKNWQDVGYVPQTNVTKSVAFPVTSAEILASSRYRYLKGFRIARKEEYESALKGLERFGLAEYAQVPFSELSGGLQQRVMIARAMLDKPRMLILDEPTAGVDEESKRSFLKLLNDLKDKEKLTYILVTHEKELVYEILDMDYRAEIRNGRLEYV